MSQILFLIIVVVLVAIIENLAPKKKEDSDELGGLDDFDFEKFVKYGKNQPTSNNINNETILSDKVDNLNTDLNLEYDNQYEKNDSVSYSLNRDGNNYISDISQLQKNNQQAIYNVSDAYQIKGEEEVVKLKKQNVSNKVKDAINTDSLNGYSNVIEQFVVIDEKAENISIESRLSKLKRKTFKKMSSLTKSSIDISELNDTQEASQIKSDINISQFIREVGIKRMFLASIMFDKPKF